jgi:hypothetical protein
VRIEVARLFGVAALGIAANRVFAGASYDVAGHWTGTAQERGKSGVT